MTAALPLTTLCLLPKSFTIDFEYQHRHNLMISQMQLARRTGAFASRSRYVTRQLGIITFRQTQVNDYQMVFAKRHGDPLTIVLIQLGYDLRGVQA